MKLKYELIKALAFGIEYVKTENDIIVFSRFTEEERNALSYGRGNSFSTAG